MQIPSDRPEQSLCLPQRIDLPIHAYREKIIAAIRQHQVIVVTGETGCGKTTQLPLFCLEALGPTARIAVTQPRRIAATSIAKKVSDDLRSPLGAVAGFRTRFDECVGTDTRILFQTDGILVSEIGRDRFFRRYDAVIIDEAHERNLNIDIIIGHLRWLIKRRPDLKVIVSSATINPELFAKAFGDAPILRVTGRTYPIEIIFDPFDEKEMDLTTAVAKAVERIGRLDENGDILVFLPTERHIVSAKRKIDARSLRSPVVTLPLFARLSRAHQERIFRQSSRRKIILATNIAETSITVPGVRFVIDSGLSRIKRFLPHSRITSLPIEHISRASADQRAGRCGRMEDGVCIRLYSKDDYAAMDEFTSPEISRSGVAGVMLTMLSQRLGSIERFAFLDPPPHKAIRDGAAHLWELGAIDKEGNLTAVGREMAAYPLDPHLARILVAAKKQGALVEALVIVSALSCMDPRERPVESTDAADQAHRRFGDPISDFVWYLKLWKAYHDEWDRTHSQSRMRAFCQENFISFMRMKEWREVHAQLSSIAFGPARQRNQSGNGNFETVHKSLLTGLIANIARKKEGAPDYKMSHGAAGFVFPGSSLAKSGPPWIMFAEKVETSRVFLRTVSRIEPAWIAEVAPHLVSCRYSGPYFDEEAGTVRAMEQKVVFGLIVDQGNVAYGRINPKEAGDIFIREGIIENKLKTRHGFLAHNWTIREEIESLEAKLRVRDLYAGDEAMIAWYERRIPGVTSVHDLNKAIHSNGGDAFLRLCLEDLLTGPLPQKAAQWPDFISIGRELFPCTYRCDPASELDGLTLHLPRGASQFVSDEMLSWLVEPQWAKRIEAMFERLPRETRKRLSPLSESAERCAAMLRPGQGHFCASLSQVMKKAFDLDCAAADLMHLEIPAYLRPHVAFDDERPQTKTALDRWQSAIATWERKSLERWDFGDLPESVIVVNDPAGFPLIRYPALRDGGTSVDLVAASTEAEAKRLHGAGVAAFVRQELEQELSWLRKNASVDAHDRLHLAPLGEVAQVFQKARGAVVEKFAAPDDPLCRSQRQFETHVARAKQELAPALRRLLDDMAKSGALCAGIAGRLAGLRKSSSEARKAPVVKSLIEELHAVIATVLSDEADWEYLSRLQRYLKRLDVAAQRAVDDPARYWERMAAVRDFEERLRSAQGKPLAPRRHCRKLLEEYKISLFAQQEVKALPGTSEKKLREAFEQLS